MNKKRRIEREKKTIEAMIKIYCHGQHGARDILCPECRELMDYANLRLDRCTFQENKTICANCRVHCYKPIMRDMVKAVMRYSGPRMMYHHPLMSFRHFIDGFRKETGRVKKK